MIGPGSDKNQKYKSSVLYVYFTTGSKYSTKVCHQKSASAYFTHTTRAFSTKRTFTTRGHLLPKRIQWLLFKFCKLLEETKELILNCKGINLLPVEKNGPDDFGCTKFRWHLVDLVLCCKILRILWRLIIC